MARVNDLPPPPAAPVLSPPATVQGEEEVRIPGLDGGPTLEARLRLPAAPTRAVVLCHPHPLYGGSMHSAVILAIARLLREKAEERVATLRFNYRGVGASHGAYGEGRGEVEDARAALRFLREKAPSARVTMCGYSFGTFVGLRAAVIESRPEPVDKVVLVAPAVRVFSFLREDGQDLAGKLFIAVGDNDEFCDVAEAEELTRTLGARLLVIPGADHYFLSSRRKLAEALYPELMNE
jgi:alpha/beta superfamily hydrolase